MSHRVLQDVQFDFHPGERFVSPNRVTATDGSGNQIGSMDWHVKTGHVLDIRVDEDHQRQGVATGMWDAGHAAAAGDRAVVQPRHSSERTGAGDAWAKAVGGRRPRGWRA